MSGNDRHQVNHEAPLFYDPFHPQPYAKPEIRRVRSRDRRHAQKSGRRDSDQTLQQNVRAQALATVARDLQVMIDRAENGLL